MPEYLTSIVWGSVSREVTQPYGPNHRGIDIGLVVGTLLFAARPGTVSRLGWGYLGIAADGTNQTDYYLHIDSSRVFIGQHVDRGQLVAYSGAKQVPGGPPITGPHLHFEVQTGALDIWATSLDPVPVLTGFYGAGSGSLGEEMTPEQEAKLTETLNGVRDLNGAAFYPPTDPTYGNFAKLFEAKLKAAAANPPVPTIDFKPVLDAIAELKLELAAIRAKTDKDLA